MPESGVSERLSKARRRSRQLTPLRRSPDHSAVTFAHADYAVIDTQITTDGSLLIDLEIVRPAEDEPAFASVQLPQII